ncbi:MAG: hypothetical protein L6243_06385 [Candidatus Altiarchaeales archaeon]|nr:hypothetical protein [Candidatus Altiarchaeota archaeon]MCG2783198.1 hypothetical protein [Candidatus Altiarchaeales archaeon]MBU4266667.1 hypothetical protein [Candidatus Altiarchaeota archaeon]MBU4342059.1 hypothetical protein [Candidatus Altiarchaeota archaeon]MBU4406692.1 hypothetical protein [Candidatus Altiarchaeota archaeon]
MKFTAVLKTESGDAQSVSKALQIDNVDMENFSIDTGAEKDTIVTKIEAEKINTLLSSLDDVIKCQMVAEDNIKKMKNSREVNF